MVSRLDSDPSALAIKKKSKEVGEGGSSLKVYKPVSKNTLLFFFGRIERKPLYQLLSVETGKIMKQTANFNLQAHLPISPSSFCERCLH